MPENALSGSVTISTTTSSNSSSSSSSITTFATGTSNQSFDPTKLESSAGRFVFDAPEVVAQYMKTHFRHLLSDEERREMLSVHPRPLVDALQVPKVDESVTSWLGSRYPKTLDSRLTTIQTAVMAAVGPVASAWSALVPDQKEDSAVPQEVPADDVIDTCQRTAVLLGNVNALLTHIDRGK